MQMDLSVVLVEPVRLCLPRPLLLSKVAFAPRVNTAAESSMVVLKTALLALTILTSELELAFTALPAASVRLLAWKLPLNAPWVTTALANPLSLSTPR